MAAAKALDVPLKILLAPNSNKVEAKKILKKENLSSTYLKKHLSSELHQRGIDLHYPAVITFQYKKLDRYAKHGYEPKEIFLSYLKKEFAK